MKSLHIIPLLACTLLTGCLYQNVNTTELKKAVYLCGDTENIEWIRSEFVGGGMIKCTSGEKKSISNIHIPKDEGVSL